MSNQESKTKNEREDTKATSKLEETVKADDGWEFLEPSESVILLKDFPVALQYQSNIGLKKKFWNWQVKHYMQQKKGAKINTTTPKS